uniref:Uncharacterized protein n=1 Tax=Molossus molossus TaxID=27622 RepID=A0A7J8I980_MOLMO|nr:hypothetical protein HJG59_010662 [Molossus molossus]
MELEVGDRGFLKITFSSVTTWTVRGARGWDQMHPPPPLPMPPVAARTPYSPGLGVPACLAMEPGTNCGKKQPQLCPCGPSGHQSLRPSQQGPGQLPGPGPHLTAGAKAQILPGLRRLQWLTLHTAPTGYRLAGADFLSSTQLSPAGLGAQGALGKPAPSDLQLVRKSHEGSHAAATFHWAVRLHHPRASHCPQQNGKKPCSRTQWELTLRGQGVGDRARLCGDHVCWPVPPAIW